MTYHGQERRKTNKAVVAAIAALILALIVLSTWGLFVAQHATTTANRSENGFCIAVHLIEQGAVADSRVARSPSVTPEIRRIRTVQYTSSLRFALQLRQLGFHCRPPSAAVNHLVEEIKRSEK